LVHFQEEQLSSIVPIKRVEKKEDLCAGENCYVIWSDNKKYPGTLIFSGIDLVLVVCDFMTFMVIILSLAIVNFCV